MSEERESGAFEFKTEPYAHQLKAFEKFRDSPYFALFMDMGTGKTKVTIDIAAHKYKTGQASAMLVLAPNHVHEQWVRDELPKHCPVPYRAFTWKSGLVGRSYYTKLLMDFIITNMNCLKVLAVNIEALQSDTVIPFIADFVKCNKAFIVVDEATRIKHEKARRTKVVHKLTKYGQRAILTGTPVAKSPFDLWSQMEFLRANYFDCNYFIFQHRYGIMMKGTNEKTGGKFQTLIDERTYAQVASAIAKTRAQRGGELMPDDYDVIATLRGVSEKNVRYIAEHPEYTRFKRLDELREYIAKDVFSVRKEDCLDLPEKVYETLYVDMLPEQAKVYRALKNDLIAQYADKELTVLNKVALMTRLMQVVGGFFPYVRDEKHFDPTARVWYERQVTDGQLIGAYNAKLEALREDLDEVGSDTKVIVWAHFVPELKYIYDQLKHDYRCCLYYGGTSDYERSRIIKAFQAGEYDVFVGNAATAGFGLNLQNATLQYYFSNSFDTEARLQAEDRSHRIGVKCTCVYKDIIVKGTVDEKIVENIRQGRDMNDYFKSVSLLELFAEPAEQAEAEQGDSTHVQ